MSKNVLLITVDSLREDYLPLDNDWTNTPAAAELAQQGISFESAFATGPATAVSFPGILTGTLPLSCGGLGPLNEDRPRLATEMQKNGFHTAGFQSNPFLSHHFNYDDGFDTFEDYQNPLMGIATKIFPRGIEVNHPKLRKIDDKVNFTKRIKDIYQLFRGKPRPYVSAEVITDDCITWIDDVESDFFAWAHYMDVHHPCYPPEKYRTEFGVKNVTQEEVSEWYSALIRSPDSLGTEELDALERLYRAAIKYTDEQIKRILDKLKQMGQLEDTLIIYTSDHGELFGDHDLYGKPERMYDELLQVPLLVANGPAKLRETTTDLISLMDIPGIIFDSVEVDAPEAYEGIIPSQENREYIIAEHQVEGDAVIGVRSDKWLFELDQIRGEKRLFEITSDQITETPTDAGGELVQSIAEKRLSELDVDSELIDDDLGEDVEGRLEDLGYL
ncbi:sulfatase [Haloferax massiliensis]|uniref:Arylsulfatase n=1 Tax=Haloferax massiliensis TaxID=1476858 RepID=A0A0D6JLD7_9EURY|nr:sulfatase [Haloferax massiliensis]CQR48727.1 Arylsulfatase [Haloferax massiliensis]